MSVASYHQQLQRGTNNNNNNSSSGGSGGGSCYSNNNNYNNGPADVVGVNGGSVRLAGDNTKDRMYEPKHNQKAVRVLTVIAYIFFVSLAAIMLSLYYVFLWNPPSPQPSSKLMTTANCSHGGHTTPTASLETPKAMPIRPIDADDEANIVTTTEMNNNYNENLTMTQDDYNNNNNYNRKDNFTIDSVGENYNENDNTYYIK